MPDGATSAHFSAAELACHHCGVNGCQQALVDLLEQFRLQCMIHTGDPTQVIVDDAYRCPAHNAATKNAAKNSVHQLGLAADVKVKVLAPEGVSWLTSAEMEMIARRCNRVTGIGRDDFAGYIHLDARTDRTSAAPAQWCYTSSGASCPYTPPSSPPVQSA